MGYRAGQPAGILYVLTGVMFKIDWVIDQTRLHTRIIPKTPDWIQFEARLSGATTEPELLFAEKSIYAVEVHSAAKESFVP